MKNIFKIILKYLFANTKLDENVSNALETAKTEITELDKKFDSLKEEVKSKKTSKKK
jgi:ppGpp synthetase/RelA/SpoT-type nucleotidyltranferase